MRHLATWLLCASWIFLLPSPAQSNAPPETLSLPQYIQILDDSLAEARQLQKQPEDAARLRDNLPSSWHVHDSDRDYDIPTDSLRRDLGAWQSKQDDTTLQRILQHLETLRAEASSQWQPNQDASGRRALLNSILAQPEFHDVQGQTWLDRLKERFTRWLINILGRAISSSSIPVISDIIVYGLIAAAVLALAWWMYRSLKESSRVETIMPVAVPVSAKEWPIWLAEARAAAAQGRWREAVHLCYWSGISFLEAGGSWRPDAARTPREYLRLLPSTSTQHPALRSLTQKLERVWYGMHPADADSFHESLKELENLGCPCN
jgi:hypothetical protein